MSEITNKNRNYPTRQRHSHARIVIVLLLLFTLAACDAGNSDDVTFVIVTGEAPTADASDPLVGQRQNATRPPSTLIPATATITSIPPTPTPDIAPNVALQVADRNLLDGRYEAAISGYQGILNRENATPEFKAAAAYGMGQAALREGLFQNAVDAFTILINEFQTDYRAQQAYFLRGDAYLGLSQWQAAINDFQQYLALRPGIIDSYAYERIGDAQLALDQYDAAFQNYTLATDANRSLVPQLALREKVARLHTLRGETEQTIAQYDAILAVAQNAPYRADIEFRAAQALIEAGQIQNGLVRMRRIVDQYQDTAFADDAMQILIENNAPLDSYNAGLVYYLAGNYPQAIDSFNTYTTEVTLAEIPAQLHLLLGRAYREIGNDAAAQVAFQTVTTQYPNDPAFGDALLEQGRTRFLAGEIDAAILQYSQIAENYDYLTPTAAEAMWRVAYLYGTNGNPAESQNIFLQLAERYPNTEQAVSGLFIAASSALSSGNNAGAEALYERLATITGGEDRAESYLQVGRLALERGDQAKATEALNLAAAAAPDTYYSARANDIVAGRAPFTAPVAYVFEFDDLADVTEAENWIRATFGVTQEGPLWPLSPALEAEPRIIRGRELWAVGAFDEATTEFLDVLSDYSQDGLASYQIAILMRIIGAYYPSQVGAANMIQAAGLSTLQAPAYIARMRYPAFYQEVVRETASRYALDPLLIFSLIRHESLFNTYATAAAGEKGLTQVIPGTGEYIAGQLNWPDYQHADLFRPYAGIEFGAYYLSEQMQRFEGNTYAALAGYNAGPGRAIDWLALSGGEPDAFMSAITIDSTQLYVQLIYRNYAIYRTLYGVDA